MMIHQANSSASVNQVQSYEKMLLVGLSGIMFFSIRFTNFSLLNYIKIKKDNSTLRADTLWR